MTLIKAHLRYLRIAPRKTRLIAELVKGMPVNVALKQLAFLAKRPAQPLLKLLKSAISNAKVNFRLDPENLYIKEFKVDEAPILKRYMPRARGRATVIRKRRSHITLVLSEREKSKVRI
jgi:large subunit ribosomal protein L22